MFGFLNVHKPKDHTSHDVIAILRKKIGIKKIGHCGTLDPFATGVLIVGINEATRLLEFIDSDKVYLAEIKFGIQTDTDDITGKEIKRSENIPSEDEIRKKLESFTGKIKQKPPIYSSIKLNGNRAYSLARKEKITLDDIKEKEVEIFSNNFISYNNNILELKIHCSSGTYIRSIARDLGLSLNTFATLYSLKRTAIGKFNVDESLPLDQITKENYQNHIISPTDYINLKTITLRDDEIKDIIFGRSLNKKFELSKDSNYLILADKNNQIVAIGASEDGKVIQPKKVLIKSD